MCTIHTYIHIGAMTILIDVHAEVLHGVLHWMSPSPTAAVLEVIVSHLRVQVGTKAVGLLSAPEVQEMLVPTYLLTYLLTYLPTCLLTYLGARDACTALVHRGGRHLPGRYLLTYLPTYLLRCKRCLYGSRPSRASPSPRALLTYLLTYLLT